MKRPMNIDYCRIAILLLLSILLIAAVNNDLRRWKWDGGNVISWRRNLWRFFFSKCQSRVPALWWGRQSLRPGLIIPPPSPSPTPLPPVSDAWCTLKAFSGPVSIIFWCFPAGPVLLTGVNISPADGLPRVLKRFRPIISIIFRLLQFRVWFQLFLLLLLLLLLFLTFFPSSLFCQLRLVSNIHCEFLASWPVRTSQDQSDQLGWNMPYSIRSGTITSLLETLFFFFFFILSLCGMETVSKNSKQERKGSKSTGSVTQRTRSETNCQQSANKAPTKRPPPRTARSIGC